MPVAVLAFGHVDDVGERAKDEELPGSTCQLHRGSETELIALSKKVGQVVAKGKKLLSVRAAFTFPASVFVPVKYGGNSTAPFKLLRSQDGFEFLLPVENGTADYGHPVASFHKSNWCVDQERQLVGKTEESKIQSLMEQGFVEAQATSTVVGLDGFDKSTDCLMVRQMLIHGMPFRESLDAASTSTLPTSGISGSMPTLTDSYSSPDRAVKKAKLDG